VRALFFLARNMDTSEKSTENYPYFGVTSFSELEELQQVQLSTQRVQELSSQFKAIALNIVNDDEVVDKEAAFNHLAAEYKVRVARIESGETPEAGEDGGEDFETKTAIKRENGIDFPPRDYAFVPDPLRPTTWKLRLTEAPGRVSAAQLNRAAAALSSSGFRGNRALIPPAALSAVKRRVRAEFRKLGVPEQRIPASVKEIGDGSGLSIWKDASTGEYKWFAVYSNQFRDDDYPSEIISEEAHRHFVKMVDAGLWDYPEVWTWHTDGSAWGKAEMVDYVDGFAVAGGTVYPGKERVAESLAAMEDLGVSHGMPVAYIERDAQNPSIITQHKTIEISPLPHNKAANKLTGFVILKGDAEMPFDPTKREWMLKAGWTEEEVDEMARAIKSVSDVARDSGLEFKESGEAVAEAVEQEEVAAAPVPEEAVVADANAAVKETADHVTKEEVAALFGEVLGAIKQISDALAASQQEITQLKAQRLEEVQALKEVTPTASMMSLRELAYQNVIGKEAARLDGRSALAKEGPRETAPTQEVAQATMIPFINQQIASNLGLGAE
jgi:hypothetical protein